MWALATTWVRWIYPLNTVSFMQPLLFCSSHDDGMLLSNGPCTYLKSYIPTASHHPKFPKMRRPCPLLVHTVLLVCCVHMWSRSLSFQWAGLWSAAKTVFSWFRQRRIARRVSQSQFWRALLGGHSRGLFGAFPTLVGGHHWSLGATFFGREIDCGDWLARGYMPADQHCDLFYPLAGDLLGSAIN